MASVFEVYKALKDLTNKDARGMITPLQFNSFAGLAQQKIVNDLFRELQSNKRLSLRQADAGRDKNRVKHILEDLSVLSKTTTISSQSTSLGSFTKPLDLSRIISMTTFGDWILDQTTTEQVQIVYDEEKLDMILRSDLSAPTEETPVALVSNIIEVFPNTVRKIRLRYYKTPEGINPLTGLSVALQPKFGYTLSLTNQEVFNASTSVDFELPDHYVPELVLEIAKYIGINLREADVYQFARLEEQTKQLTK